MKLRFLAISDTHLGEDCSLLSFPHGRQHLWRELRRAFSEDGDLGEPFQVDEVVLLGDILERALASTSQIITHGNAFVQMLGSACRAKRAVWVVGNHEYALWTEYLSRRLGLDPGRRPTPTITGGEGELIVEHGKRCDMNGAAEDILSIFFGYPHGAAWRAIERTGTLDFAIANPVYATQFQGRTYVFTHGTHFRPDVLQPGWVKRLIDHAQLDRILGHLEIESSGDIRHVPPTEGLLGLERAVASFVDSLWPSAGNNPTPWTDDLWHIVTMLGGRIGRKRLAPEETRLFSREDLGYVSDQRIPRLIRKGIPQHGAVERWRRFFLPHLLHDLASWGMPASNLTFVFGDTHSGRWGKMELPGDRSVRLYNTGGWTVGNPTSHPACQVFAVNENGEEFILDVSFRDVRVGSDTLLKLAGWDEENRWT